VKLTQNNSSLFASFEDRVELDGNVRNMQIGSSVANKSVFFSLPHFWSIAVLDPGILIFFLLIFFVPCFTPSYLLIDYSVLLADDDKPQLTPNHKVPVMDVSLFTLFFVYFTSSSLLYIHKIYY
jgi:hypothetical protein